ncbi:hypothetical protein ACIGO8_26395 [Streptomyces sp. NPDC053493]|uniref:hypothetical protein n=1 Tax=Streptomyces sp. NPDC053493 TaxID=3365705 RepID=UPI0037CD4D6B
MTTHSPWRGLGAVGLRLADVAARYVLAYLAAWLAVGLTTPRVTDSWQDPSEFPSRGALVLEHLGFALDMVWVIAVPSVLISWLCALFGERTGTAFRARLAGLLLLPLWFLLFASTAHMLLFLALGHLVFALVVMPVPLMPAHGSR